MDNECLLESIAIVGTARRLPGGALGTSKLWEPSRDPFSKTRQGYFLDEDIRQFDPGFFRISPVEAENRPSTSSTT
jgi:acyl transferase domain-containing protein